MARGRLERESGSSLKRPGAIAAAVVLALIALLGLADVVIDGHGHHAGSPAPRAAVTQTPNRGSGISRSSSAAMSGGPNHCSLAAGSQSVPAAPPVAQWTLLGSMAIPTSDQVGPQRKVDGLPVCYAHNPAGALFAAVAFWAAATADPPSVVYEHLAADTPQRREAIAGSRGDNERLSDHGQVSVAGFQFSSYAPQSADVTIVLQTTQDVMVSVGCTMLWQDGDWHYEIPPGNPPAAQIDSLTGFIGWGAAS